MPKSEISFAEWYRRRKPELELLSHIDQLKAAWHGGEEASTLNSFLSVMDLCKAETKKLRSKKS